MCVLIYFVVARTHQGPLGGVLIKEIDEQESACTTRESVPVYEVGIPFQELNKTYGIYIKQLSLIWSPRC